MRGGPGVFLRAGQAPSPIVEVKHATQHVEIQRLLTENQRPTTTHISLKRELVFTHKQLERSQQVIGGSPSDGRAARLQYSTSDRVGPTNKDNPQT